MKIASPYSTYLKLYNYILLLSCSQVLHAAESEVSISPAVEITFNTKQDIFYQLKVKSLSGWSDIGLATTAAKTLNFIIKN